MLRDFGCFHVFSCFLNSLYGSFHKDAFLYDVPTAQGLAVTATSENWFMQVNKTPSDAFWL